MDKILVTGGNGLLGGYVVRELSKHYEVSVADRTEGEFNQPHGPVDVLNIEALSKCMQGQDAVVHLAAVDAAVEAPPHAYFHTNVLAAWNVLHCGYEAGVRRFSLCSSSSAYGIRPSDYRGVPRYLPVDESHPLLASDPYGLSKRACEITAEGFSARDGMSVTVLRPCFVAFPYTVPHMRDVKAGTEQPAKPGERAFPLPPLRWFVAPEDAARCFRAAVESNHRFEVFNVSARETFNPVPTLERLHEVFGPVEVNVEPDYFDANPMASPMRCDKARKMLGWTPGIDWAALDAGSGVD